MYSSGSLYPITVLYCLQPFIAKNDNVSWKLRPSKPQMSIHWAKYSKFEHLRAICAAYVLQVGRWEVTYRTIIVYRTVVLLAVSDNFKKKKMVLNINAFLAQFCHLLLNELLANAPTTSANTIIVTPFSELILLPAV